MQAVEAERRGAARMSPGGRGREPWVLFHSGVRWRFHRQRQHELARELGRRFRVLFIEPPALDGSLSPTPRPVAPGVWVVRPWGPFPLGRVVPPLNLLTRLSTARALRRFVRRQGVPAVTWIDEDLAAPCAGRSAELAVVYDGTDEDWTFTRRWNRWHLRREMENACRRATVLISSSRTLAERMPGGREPVVVPNACDPARFTPEGPIAPELRGARGPVLGFAGSATERALDLRLLKAVAARRPDWSIVLVGMAEARVAKELRGHANVTLLGPVPYERLPSLVRGFDAGLIPYRVGGLIDYVLPKKLYEYLAAGKPVVATPLPELRSLGGGVRLASDVEGFVKAVEDALSETAEEGLLATEARRALALEETWEERGRVVRQLVAGLLEGVR